MKNTSIKIRISNFEKNILQRKAKKTGLSLSEFIRRVSLEIEIKNTLSEDEITCYKNLSKYADNFRRISNLFKLGDVTGMKKETLETSQLIKAHLEKFKN